MPRKQQTEDIGVYHLGETPVRLQRKNVRHLRLRVTDRGDFFLSIPRRAPLATAREFLEEQRDWVENQRHRLRAKHANAPRFETGEEIAWWGQTLTLQVVMFDPAGGGSDPKGVGSATASRGAIRGGDRLGQACLAGFEPVGVPGGATPAGEAVSLGAIRGSRAESPKPGSRKSKPRAKAEVRGDTLRLMTPPGTNATQREGAVDQLRRASMETRLAALLPKWTAAFGITETGAVRIRRMKTRWGSCNPRTRALTFNLELSARDPKFLEYVVAHELTHYFHSNHGPEFHALLGAHLPGERALRRELNSRQP